ncbi:capsid morphogenesis protein [Gordonia phage SmokingBunny]|uniref:ADP-ribosyltransferase domain and MuF-like fusion protein n=2 Tax=Wizardvirus TaxID=2169658 RepID=A0A6M3T0K0_9CAUD|nr:head morphogenesis [Gordonia phage SmokingBunny]YP_010107650.1 head morphogenesis [Gordonia phage Evamon]UVK62339.1 ADP-ribosyltransferase [Gordonia phage Salvador]WAA20232.1 VIP2-like ADP-ribosyltransferase toxin [Gordonia phage Togo]QCG77825.1 capsid morphogenesis protein [Gordonia phage SmokingBunny]QJD51509.1 ADP-ribosyltransferase domain and MuF-like fusion protein [Gordonia phage Evamon]
MPSQRQADRARASRRLLLRAERRIDAAVLGAIDAWLTAVRFHLFRELGEPDPIRAAAYPHGPHIVDAAVQASYGEWRHHLDRQVIPSVSIEFSEAFQQARQRDPLNSYRYQQQYLEEVSDRLKIWPEGAFEDIRPELMEALAEGESIDEIRDRVGRVLNIDARTRAIRATIHEVEQRLADPDIDPNTRRVLNARRRELWNEHDDSLGEWQWKARRIARTEAHGAVSAGTLASALARQEFDPELRLYKRWLATEDTRVRATHRVADGQVVPLTERFRVGGFLLDHPADAITIAPHEVINCRCAMLIYDDDELQDELQGPDGSIGEIRPGGIRLGPDDPDDADRVIAEVAKEEGLSRPARLGQRGEDRGQPTPAPAEPVELTDEREKLPPPDRPARSLADLSDDQLLDEMQRANDTNDGVLWEQTNDEWERRHSQAAEDPQPINNGADSSEPVTSPAYDSDDAPPPPPPPEGPTLTPTPDDEPIGGPTPAERDAAAEVLDEEYADDVAELTWDERDIIEAWQRDDRTYEEFQKAARLESDDPDLMARAGDLDELVRQHRLRRPVQAYRGIRDARKVFGVDASDLAELVGQDVELRGFFGVSLDRAVALDEFTNPSLGGGAALIDVQIPAGIRALWVAAAGAAGMRRQLELLLPSPVVISVLDVDYSGTKPVIRVRVSTV